MLLIDEDVDARLMAILNAPEEKTRYVYLTLAGTPIVPNMKDTLIAIAQETLSCEQKQLYFCDNGDVCVMCDALHSREGSAFISKAAAAIKRDVSLDWVVFDELQKSGAKLAARVQSRLDARAALAAEEQKKQQEKEQEAKRDAILSGGAALDAKKKALRASRPTPLVMVIEDDAFSRKLVERALEKDHKVTLLPSAENALNMYSQFLPNVLFLDINLPDVTGHELLEKIMKIDPDAYVVMLSGNADSTNISQAMKRGAKGFVGKPFTKDKLLQYVQRCPTINA